MFRILLCFCLIAMPLVSAAQKAYVLGDTIYVADNRKEVPHSEATLYGVVKHVNTEANVAAIHYFNRSDNQLLSVEHRVASGADYGRKKGKQIYFDENGKMTSMEQYTLVYDERKGKTRSRLAQEQLFYPDGKIQEDLQLTYEITEKGERKSYDRKCYYPDGNTLKYRELSSDNQTTNTYYDESGLETENPVEMMPLYETMPSFPGGQSALFDYLSSTVKYPSLAQRNRIEGRVIVEFVVDKDGSITNVKVLRSGGDPSLDKEAVRVVRRMPNWQPGTKRGKLVRVKYTIPVNFRLE